MARITTNTTGTQPVIWITTDLTANASSPTGGFTPDFDAANSIQLPFVQDVTVTNSTGVYSYTTFSDIDTRKLSTPADNTISTNVVIDDVAWYGNASATANSAVQLGVQSISSNKTPVGFRVYVAGTANVAGTVSRYREGVGFITNLAPTTTPDAPVWITPLEIAVDGSYRDGSGAVT